MHVAGLRGRGELRAGQMAGGAVARRGVVQRAGRLLRGGNQVLAGLDLRMLLGIHEQDIRQRAQ
ncbi:hypothetical protein D3C87_1543660 [compost metagenome]